MRNLCSYFQVTLQVLQVDKSVILTSFAARTVEEKFDKLRNRASGLKQLPWLRNQTVQESLFAVVTSTVSDAINT